MWTRGAISSRLAPGLLLCSSGWPVRASLHLTLGCSTRAATLQFNAARRSPWHPHAKRRGPCDVFVVDRTLMESCIRLAKIAEKPAAQALAATEIWGAHDEAAAASVVSLLGSVCFVHSHRRLSAAQPLVRLSLLPFAKRSALRNQSGAR